MPSLRVILLTSIWFLLFSLGSPSLPSSNLPISIAIAMLAVILISLRVFHAGNSDQDVSSNLRRKGLSPVIGYLLASVLALVVMSSIANSFGWSEDFPGHVLLVTSVIALSQAEMKVNLAAIQSAALVFLGLGWFFQLFVKSNPVSYTAGFAFNPLGERFVGLAAHPNTAGFLCVVVFLVALFVFSNTYASLFSVVTLVLTENRGGLLSVFMIFSIWIVAFPRKTNLLTKLASVILFVAATTVLFSGNRAGNQDVTSGRGDIWDVCLSKISENQFLGFGPKAIAREFGLDQVFWFRPFHCHNQVLDDAVNFGVPAAALSLLLLLLSIVKAGQNRYFALMSLFVAFLTVGFFEVPVRWFVAPGFIWQNALYLVATLYVVRTSKSLMSGDLVELQDKHPSASSNAHSSRSFR